MIDIAAIIPALNPRDKLIDLVNELFECGIEKVIVVNDGSDERFDHLFEAVEKIEGCHVLRHERNMGKGRALKTAFAYFLDNFPNLSGVVTADADGQHCCEDICNIARHISKERPSLILGVRDFDREQIPFRSYLGNKFTSKMFQLLYGGDYIQDTQTGLRGIPGTELKWMVQLSGERYEYEINMLLQARKRVLDIVQVPIQTLYFDNNSDSHYNTFKDSFKIFGKMIAGMSKYIASSITSGAIDIAIFTILNAWILSRVPIHMRILLATVIARICSSLYNFSINRKFVFETQKGVLRPMGKYYVLFVCQLLCSYLLVYTANRHLSLNATFAKILIDIILGFISYQIQLRWVFRKQ